MKYSRVHRRRFWSCGFTADKPGRYTGSIALQDGHDAQTVADGHTLKFASSLANGLKYESQLLAINDGGVLRVEGSKINFSGCDALTLVLAVRTDYVMDASRHFRGDPPHERVTADLAGIASNSFDALKAEHVADYQVLFNRVAINLGTSKPIAAQPTDRSAQTLGSRAG